MALTDLTPGLALDISRGNIKGELTAEVAGQDSEEPCSS